MWKVILQIARQILPNVWLLKGLDTTEDQGTVNPTVKMFFFIHINSSMA